VLQHLLLQFVAGENPLLQLSVSLGELCPLKPILLLYS
jgi:hypothetical protein